MRMHDAGVGVYAKASLGSAVLVLIMFLVLSVAFIGRKRWPLARQEVRFRPVRARHRNWSSAAPRTTPQVACTATASTNGSAPNEHRDRLVLVGLGNPGPKYEKTRHNAGFLAADAVARAYRAPAFRLNESWQALHTHIDIGRQVHILKPITYMNLSGQALRSFLRDTFGTGFERETEWSTRLLVLVDDTALPFGKLRLRLRGSDGGHNGLKSIAQALRSERYSRLRIGIGGDNRAGNGSAVDYVLSDFSRAEWRTMEEQVLIDCVQVARHWIEHDDLAKVVQFCNAARSTMHMPPA
jgi:PTH1 family peptidyl-tRNA hydrolase